jgi:predicted esterase
VTTPKGYKPGTPVPVFIALHGLGSQPEDFGRSGEPQDLADELGAAIVSISATEPWGKNSFSWKEDFEADWTHIQKSLERVKDKVTPQPGRCIAAGFSQGGQLAAELAAAHPDFFAGAIVMSPGYRGQTPS